MQLQSTKTFQWLYELLPDLYLGIILFISSIVVGSSFKLFYKMLKKPETLKFRIITWQKWVILAFAISLFFMILGNIWYRIEAFYMIKPIYTSYLWKLNLFTSFTMLLMLAAWVFKSIINKDFASWKETFNSWRKKGPSEKTKNIEKESKIKKSIVTQILSPSVGTIKDISKVDDEIFSKKMLGDGLAVVPTIGEVYAPISGTLQSVFPTKHAYGIKSDENISVLIHIGIDTIKLKGKGFKTFVKQGQKVEKGQKLAQFDLKLLKEKNIISDVIMLVLDESNVKIKKLRKSGKVTKKTNVISTY